MSATDTDNTSIGQALWMTVKRVAPGLVVMAAVLGVLAIWRIPKRDTQAEPVPPPPVNVTVMVVQAGPVEDTFELPGVVAPLAVARLAAEVPGRIRRIAVREGESIRAGQPLIYLETDLLQAEVDRARAQAQFGEQELHRIQVARTRNVATEMELDLAQSTYDKSKADLEAAEARLRRAVIRAPDARLGRTDAAATAPGAEPPVIGVLNELPVEVGDYVQAGTYVAELVDISIVKVVMDVPEPDVRYIEVGLRAANRPTVRIESLGNREIDGVITFLSPRADERTRTFRTEITAPNPRGDILAGMVVKVRLLRRTLPEAVMAPLAAVIPLEDSQGYEVYVVNDSKAHRRQVRLGLIQGRYVQLLDFDDPDRPALRTGERLITTPRLVGDGQDVAVRPSAEDLLEAATQPATQQTQD